MATPNTETATDEARRSRRRRWVCLGAKTVHDLASITFGGALVACTVLNQMVPRETLAEFAAARALHAAIAQYLLVPSMAVVVLSGLLALAATQAYMSAGWAWFKALLCLAVFEATLVLAVVNVLLAVWRPKWTPKVP